MGLGQLVYGNLGLRVWQRKNERWGLTEKGHTHHPGELLFEPAIQGGISRSAECGPDRSYQETA